MEHAQKDILCQRLTEAMSGHNAHIDFDSALKDFPPELRGAKADGMPHTAWQLLEHMRIAQWDILEFSRNPDHKSPNWPDEYWPLSESPEDDRVWQACVEALRRDQKEMDELLKSPDVDLFAPIPHGSGQTILREALLIANHNSYHLGQLMFLKKMLST